MAEEKQSRRDFLRKSIIASAGLVVGANAVKMLADYTHQPGRLEIINHASYNGFNIIVPFNLIHLSEGKEVYDSYDIAYGGLPPSGKLSGVVSTIPGYKLEIDSRPINSITPVNLELFLHDINGSRLVVKNIRNELQIQFPAADWKFGKKPISLWRRHFLGKGEPVGLELLAHIRKAIAKSPDRIAKIPLPNLNRVYRSQVPYDRLQLRFDFFPGDLNLDGKVDNKDYVILGNDWKNKSSKIDGGLVSDIDGPNGVPDGILDFTDANDVLADRFKDANDPNTW